MWPWLINVGQWIIRLVGGWLPIGTKPVSEWLGKVLWAVGISAAVFFTLSNLSGCKKKISAVPPGQNLNAGGSISNPTYKIEPHFGCATITFKEEK